MFGTCSNFENFNPYHSHIGNKPLWKFVRQSHHCLVCALESHQKMRVDSMHEGNL